MSSIQLRCPACGDDLEVTTSLIKTRRGNCPDDCSKVKAHAHIGLKVKAHACTFTAVVTDPTLPPQVEPKGDDERIETLSNEARRAQGYEQADPDRPTPV